MFRLTHDANAHRRIILIAAVAQPSAAQPSPLSTPTASACSELFSSIGPSFGMVLLILIFVFFFVGFFSIYIRLRGESEAVSDCDGSGRRGLDPSAMEAFPAFEYSSPAKTTVKSDECAICLSDFQRGEKLRLLIPRCGHVFHSDCIDGWLVYHVTCPVCRAELAPEVTTETESCCAGRSNDAGVNVYL